MQLFLAFTALCFLFVFLLLLIAYYARLIASVLKLSLVHGLNYKSLLSDLPVSSQLSYQSLPAIINNYDSFCKFLKYFPVVYYWRGYSKTFGSN